MFRKVLLNVAAALVLLIVVMVLVILLRWDRTFDAPLPDIRASTDSAVIARGRYLVYGPAHCAYCHSTVETAAALDRGEQPPLAGGFVFKLPVGTFRTPNLTPDSATGIGGVSDGVIARMLRHGVRRDGRAAVPFMNYQSLSDADLTALVSFLRSQPPVRQAVPPHDVNFLGKAVLAFVIKPIGPTATPPPESPSPGPTVERGAYLVSAVGECAGCHTQRSFVDGSYTGPRLAGGSPMEADGAPGFVAVAPNLTPDPKTGRITGWNEDQFVARFRQGKVIPQSPMPWGAFARMTDDDLRAIYRYLRTVPAVEHETGPSLRRSE
ncbi:MAG TPA: c-type cytochrome [Gemmatimonadales bacterium]|nr:c-type cytochrome [Gemmatimonadales bacterium]